MPNYGTIAMLALTGLGGLVGGMRGWENSVSDPTVQSAEDRMGYALSTSVIGMGVGLGLGVGGRLLGNPAFARKGLSSVMAAPGAVRGMAASARIASKSAGFAKAARIAKGPMAVLGTLGLFSAGIRVHSHLPAEHGTPDSYADRDEAGDIRYNQSSVRDRAASMGASGDMVFGLNNLRHGKQ